jgi:hypothetical protein
MGLKEIVDAKVVLINLAQQMLVAMYLDMIRR